MLINPAMIWIQNCIDTRDNVACHLLENSLAVQNLVTYIHRYGRTRVIGPSECRFGSFLHPSGKWFIPSLSLRPASSFLLSTVLSLMFLTNSPHSSSVCPVMRNLYYNNSCRIYFYCACCCARCNVPQNHFI